MANLQRLKVRTPQSHSAAVISTRPLADFQLAYAYSSFLAERAAWRAVIHLNLVRSITSMMNVLMKEFSTVFPGTDFSSSIEPEFEEDEDEKEARNDPASSPLTESHRLLLLYLAPLRRVQRDLEKSLGAASMEDVHSNGADAAPWANGGPRFRPREFAVTSRSGWKSALNRVRGIKGDGDSVHEKEGWQRQVCLLRLSSLSIAWLQHSG